MTILRSNPSDFISLLRDFKTIARSRRKGYKVQLDAIEARLTEMANQLHAVYRDHHYYGDHAVALQNERRQIYSVLNVPWGEYNYPNSPAIPKLKMIVRERKGVVELLEKRTKLIDKLRDDIHDLERQIEHLSLPFWKRWFT